MREVYLLAYEKIKTKKSNSLEMCKKFKLIPNRVA